MVLARKLGLLKVGEMQDDGKPSGTRGHPNEAIQKCDF